VEALVKRVNDKLEAHQRIRSWSIWPENDFPRTVSTKKVRRAEVRRQIAGGPKEQPEMKPEGKPEQKDLSAMSSLERVELLSELESKYQVELNEEEFSNLKSSQELEEWIRRSSARPRDRAPAVPAGKPPSEWARSLPVRSFRIAFQRLIAIPLFKHYLPLTVSGLEHLRDLEPPVIFAANHISHLDTPAVYAALPFRWRQRLAPAMALDVFRPYFEPDRFPTKQVWWTGLGYVLALCLFKRLSPSARNGRSSARFELHRRIDQTRILSVGLPEGMRSPDGKLKPFRAGIGMMAIRLRVPIVPIRIEGLYEVYSIHDSWPKPGPVRVSFGESLEFTTESYEEVAHKVQQAIEHLK
jgi:long-chain acyl-CoA synthetase